MKRNKNSIRIAEESRYTINNSSIPRK